MYMASYELYHHGILGMKWGVRRYQNKDGSLTAAGRKRYGSKEVLEVDKALTEYGNAKGKTRQQMIKEADALETSVGKVIADTRPELVKLGREAVNALNDFGNEALRLDREARKIAEQKRITDPDELEDIFIGLASKDKSYISARERNLTAWDNKVKAEKAAVQDFLGEIGKEKTRNLIIPEKESEKSLTAYSAVYKYINHYVRDHPKEGWHYEYSGGFDGNKFWDSKKLVKDK